MRITSSGETILGLLGVSDVAATDTVPTDVRVACYRLESLSVDGALQWASDILCVFPRLAFGTGANQVSIAFRPAPMALVSWNGGPGSTGYVLVPFGTAGGQILPGTARSALHDTHGRLTCFIVVAQSGPRVAGISDAVCGFPLSALVAP
jgi:hypothetical protein